MKRIDTSKDSITLYSYGPNGWGDKTLKDTREINCLFQLGMTQNRNDYVDGLGTDAHVYLNEEDEYVLSQVYRLEGCYVNYSTLGGDEKDNWYKIERVKPGRETLTTNEINCVHCFLTKSTPHSAEIPAPVPVP